jgi:hypothetical protein
MWGFSYISYMRYLLVILIMILVIGCEEEDKVKQIKHHQRLLGFKSVFLAESGDTSWNKIVSGQRDSIEIKYINDIIYVTLLTEVNACATYDGNIKINNGTISLEYIQTNSIVCTSSALDKLTYIIDNPLKKKYSFSLDNVNIARKIKFAS